MPQKLSCCRKYDWFCGWQIECLGCFHSFSNALSNATEFHGYRNSRVVQIFSLDNGFRLREHRILSMTVLNGIDRKSSVRKFHSFHLNSSQKCGHCHKFCVILETVNKEYFFYKMVDELINI